MKKTVFFIRHAEKGNLDDDGINRRRSDITLSDKGIQQAAAMAGELQKPDLIIVSPYLRAVQTAHPIMSKFPNVPVELWGSVQEFEPLSDSQHYSVTRPERAALHDEYWAMNDCAYSNGIGAESFNEFMGRVDYTLDRLRDMALENIVVVSHYWFINAALMRINEPEKQITPKYFDEHLLKIKNAEIIKANLP